MLSSSDVLGLGVLWYCGQAQDGGGVVVGCCFHFQRVAQLPRHVKYLFC
jgi:hypothetical protein